MKKKYKMILLAAVCVFFCLYGLFYILKPEPFDTCTALVEDLADTYTVQGTLAPVKTEVILAPIGGTITKLPAIGSVIPSGQMIVAMDDSEIRQELEEQILSLTFQQSMLDADQLSRREQLASALASAQLEYNRMYKEGGSAAADLAAAQAAYDQALTDYRGGQELKNGGYLSSQALGSLYLQLTTAGQGLAAAQSAASEDTKAYYEALIASYELQLNSLEEAGPEQTSAMEAGSAQLQLSIDQLKRKLDDTTLTASYEAVVSEILAAEGSFVAAKQPLVSVYSNQQLKIQANLLAMDATRIKEGMEVTITLADDRSFQGVVSFVSMVAVEQLSSVGLKENRCLVEITSGDLPSDLGAGHPVDILFSPVLAYDALTIPLSCIVPMNTSSGYGVYVVKGRRKVLTPVVTGIKCNGRVQVLSGLTKWDTLELNP